MRKKVLILFTLISSLALSNTRDLKMKMVLNKEDIKPIVKEEKIATPSVKKVTKIEEEKKDSKIQMVVWSIVGAFALIFNRIIKKNKGGK